MKAATILAGALSLCASAQAQTAAGLDMGKVSSAANVAYGPHEAVEAWAPDPAAESKLWKFAACAVRNSSKLAGSVLEAAPATPEAHRRTLRLMQRSGCTGSVGQIKMRSEVVRWALAEQLHLSSQGNMAAAPPVTVRAAPDAYALGSCIAQRDPAGSDAFVRTARRSPAEAAAFKRIVPSINACAGKTKLNLSGAAIHGVLAEALYKSGSTTPGSN